MKIYEFFGDRGLIGDMAELNRGSRVELSDEQAEALLARDFPIRAVEEKVPGQSAQKEEDTHGS